MKIFVTGAAGFIGSNLVDRLLAQDHQVIGWDNFSTGQKRFLEDAMRHPNFVLHIGDNLDLPSLTNAMTGCEIVFHLAANADVRFGLKNPSKDLEQNTQATFNVLEAMRSNSIKIIAFSSTGSVYGETEVIPTPEDAPFPVQTSLYGASKVASECLIQAYCEGFGMEAYIFRFVSILGERYTHGHVIDFYKQLMADPHQLHILGDGSQRKSYLYIQDCLDAMLHVTTLRTARDAKHHCRIYNLGTPEYCKVTDSVDWICDYLNLKPNLKYAGGTRGWVGDNPFIFLDTQKIQDTGWKATATIRQAMIKTVAWLEKNQWIFSARD